MLICNLSVLLAEKKLKITQVSKDTGISRTTLTSLANNYSKGIQFDTFNKLCYYLNAQPKDLFLISKHNLEILKVNVVNDDIQILCSVNSISNTFRLFGTMSHPENKDDYLLPYAYVQFPSQNNYDNIEEFALAQKICNETERIFLPYLEQLINNKLDSPSDKFLHIQWDKQFYSD